VSEFPCEDNDDFVVVEDHRSSPDEIIKESESGEGLVSEVLPLPMIGVPYVVMREVRRM
jgi:hypothetical protein